MTEHGDTDHPTESDREHERKLIEAAEQEATEIAAIGSSTPPPDSFAGYNILREIRRGGQGVVYQAIQKSTKRKVAIKVMKEGPFAGSTDRARFDREVEILGQLNHPNIVTIHDSGTAAGHFFFVMDYISGNPLDVWMASGERSIDETLKLFAKICQAVNAAHLQGVIHRDLKPGNIRIDGEGEPHVLDFGLAKVAVGHVSNGSRPQAMTITGQFMGSLPWASPEQAEAIPGKIDIRTDVYALGVILYQMLTGKFPYEVVGNMRDVLDNILKAEPAKPSTVRKQINDEVETIVLKCLSKERERRYQSAGELGRDIGHYMAGDPIEAKRDSALYVLRKQFRRYRFRVAVGAAFVLIGAAGLATSLTFWSQAARERDEAEVSRVEAERAKEHAEGALAERDHALQLAWALGLEAAELKQKEAPQRLQKTIGGKSDKADCQLWSLLSDFTHFCPELDILVSWPSLHQVGVKPETLATLSIHGDTKCQDILNHALASASNGRDALGYRITRGRLYVASKADLAKLTKAEYIASGFFGYGEVRVADVVDENPMFRFRLLDRPGDLRFETTGFAQILERLHETTGIKFVCRWAELNAMGIQRETPVTIRLPHASVLSLLSAVFVQLNNTNEGIGWTVDQDRILISSRQALKRWLATQPTGIADRLVDSLFQELITREKVLKRIRSDSTLDDRVRRLASWTAERREVDPLTFLRRAWPVVASPGHDIAAYRLVLGKVEAVRRLDPNEMRAFRSEGGSTVSDFSALGAAQFRIGRYEDAIVTLKGLKPHKSVEPWTPIWPVDLAFTAMAHYKLEHIIEARAHLNQLRDQMQELRHRENEELLALLHEAESLILGIESPGGDVEEGNSEPTTQPASEEQD